LLYDTHGLERLEVEMMAMKTAQQRSQADLYTIKRSSEVVVLKNAVFFSAMSNKVVLQDQEELRGCSFKRMQFFLCDVK
jgi:hypothetical protein